MIQMVEDDRPDSYTMRCDCGCETFHCWSNGYHDYLICDKCKESLRIEVF